MQSWFETFIPWNSRDIPISLVTFSTYDFPFPSFSLPNPHPIIPSLIATFLKNLCKLLNKNYALPTRKMSGPLGFFSFTPFLFLALPFADTYHVQFYKACIFIG